MEITPVNMIRPYTEAGKIVVRLCRIWKTKDRENDESISSIDCVFVDNQGNGIHATMQPWLEAVLMPQLNPGSIYEIEHYYPVSNSLKNAIVRHPARLDLRRKTRIREIGYSGPEIPLHFFSFIDYENITATAGNENPLTDLIGYLDGMQEIEKQPCRGNRIQDKREFILLDERRNRARVTFWGKHARLFDLQALESQDLPLIVVFTSLKAVEYRGGNIPTLNATESTMVFYNPDIPQLAPYRQVFSSSTAQIKILPPSPASNKGINRIHQLQRKTIEELLLLDPATHQHERYTCKARILDVNLANGWFYEACHICFKQLDVSSEVKTCQKCGVIKGLPLPCYKIHFIVEDDVEQAIFILMGTAAERVLKTTCYSLFYEHQKTNPKVLPEEIAKFIGTEKIFEVRFGQPKLSYSRYDLLVSSIFEIETESTMSISIPPQENICKPTLAESSKDPSSMTYQKQHQHLQDESKLKRKLTFTASEEEKKHASEQEYDQLDEDVEGDDSDHIPLNTLKQKHEPKRSKSRYCTTYNFRVLII
ncbi:hypothetical protein Tsubulata_019605 [Turnera subulata]|uniref:Replication factor A C-terminal domain-containing protein n=1 Tax=Turnera subulata TaxID=218843 RepID=A0A9Q0FA80_9ROSI|nr:hypothetical protein Tsubulata_019605 [Turnera subulata]